MSPQRGPVLPYTVVAGVTACPTGWLAQSAKLHGSTFAPELPKIYPTFLELLDERPTFTVIVLNVTIGWHDTVEMGPRTCDREARALLRRRGAAVANAPSRAVLEGVVGVSESGLDAVSMTMLPRYREIAVEMSPYRQRQIYSGHPELSFYQLNHDTELRRSKRLVAGRDERLEILASHLPGIERILEFGLEGASEKHLYDAMALLWTARRVRGHAAKRIPEDAQWDSEGLRMEFVY